MFNTLITGPFGSVLNFIYSLVNNYGLAIIIFCIVCKLLLFPLTLKSKKSMFANARIQPKMQELQKKYKNDKDRYSMELQKLYKEEKVSPLAGCLPLLITMPILFGLYYVVTQPLYFLMKYSEETIRVIAGNIVTVLGNHGVNPDSFARITAYVENASAKSNTLQIELANYMSQYGDELQAMTPDVAISKFNFDFLGMNLSKTPSYEFWTPNFLWGLFILVLVSVATAFLVGWLGQKLNPMQTGSPDDPTAKSAASTGKMMIYIMPLMTAFIGFSIPAAVSVYWITNNLLTIGLDVLANKIAGRKEEEIRQKKLEDEARRKRNKKKAAELDSWAEKQRTEEEDPKTKEEKEVSSE